MFLPILLALSLSTTIGIKNEGPSDIIILPCTKAGYVWLIPPHWTYKQTITPKVCVKTHIYTGPRDVVPTCPVLSTNKMECGSNASHN